MNRFLSFFKTSPSLSIFSTFIVFLFLIQFSTADARQNFHFNDDEMEAEIVPRISASMAEAAITTGDGMVDLILANNSIIIQFTDKKLDQIAGEIREETSKNEESHFAEVLKSMISSGVRTLLDRGLAIPLNEISELAYEDGRLVIINQQGKEIFEDLEIDDKPVMEQFSGRDSRRFISEVERRMI